MTSYLCQAGFSASVIKNQIWCVVSSEDCGHLIVRFKHLRSCAVLNSYTCSVTKLLENEVQKNIFFFYQFMYNKKLVT